MSKDNYYRKMYKEFYKIEFDSSFEVHHIDFNRKNNVIDNLILIPKKTHKAYHLYEQVFKGYKEYPNTPLDSFYLIAECLPIYKDISDIQKVLYDLHYWIDLKHQATIEIKKSSINNSQICNFYQIEINNYGKTI